MSSPTHETFDLGPHKDITRLWCGLWQLSSNAWGSAPVPRIRKCMGEHVDLGFTAFADHYGSAEIIFGQFRKSLPVPDTVIGATKWCVFKPTIPSRAVVEAAVRERLARMQTEHVDLLQFHWQDYADKGYLTALEILDDLRGEGLVSAIGLCNFDTIRTDEICTQLGPGIIVSNQVQFSLIDTRPLHGMTDVCRRHGVKLLVYGTLVNEPEPDLYSGQLTPSQRKYLDMIVKAWGNWALFQRLLRCLRGIGDRHGGISIANIATRWVLDQDAVGAVLVGARLGLSDHLDDNLKVFQPECRLTREDREAIENVLAYSNGRKIITTIGDCGAEYR
ncbi:NADP-dependent oxidoreductase domain-containing protein [Mycena metata]|uniref:NADP-dependent oxidoreductase domain-containing protein n=1 Tax=Mycena metata TaxID=1033252 RepID=A0AAD7HW68_9AGAR|nr:NADP-dependent oxidoreductase domain-containing protein [Mycena metata]